jgi:hypothetical protein
MTESKVYPGKIEIPHVVEPLKATDLARTAIHKDTGTIKGTRITEILRDTMEIREEDNI